MKQLLLLLALPLAACATVPAPAAGPTAGLGEAAVVEGLRITPLSLVEDSRCPADVQCVWAGRLVIFAEIHFNGGSESFRENLTLGEPLPLGPQTVSLVAAAPQKSANVAIRPEAYRFTFAARPRL
jgi:hypothetical protein